MADIDAHVTAMSSAGFQPVVVWPSTITDISTTNESIEVGASDSFLVEDQDEGVSFQAYSPTALLADLSRELKAETESVAAARVPFTKDIARRFPYGGLAYLEDGTVVSVTADQLTKKAGIVYVSEDVNKMRYKSLRERKKP